MNLGSVLRIPQPGASLDAHIWMVVSDPAKDPDRVVIVNMTTWRADKDQACVLQVGDHPAVQHPTCVNYRDAKMVPMKSLLQLKDSGHLTLLEPLPDSTLARILAAVPDSQMELGRVAILEDQRLVQV